jgi:ketosteroid isomerase-like protein
MSQENVELAQRVMQALGRRDADELVRLADSEVEWHSFFALTEGGYRGHAGTRQYTSDLGDAFDVGVAEVDDGLGIGNVVVLVGRLRYRGKGSGVESATATGWILKFRDGKVTYFRAFRDPEHALAEAGLRE